MRQKGFAHFLLLLVLSVIGIGFVGYLAYQNAPLQNQGEETAVQLKTTEIQTAPTITNVSTVSPNIIENWKKYSSDGKYVWSTDDWQTFNQSNETHMFSIEFPADWTLNSSVFDDEKGDKIAEFSPGLVVLKTGQKCFENQKTDSERVKILSQNNITIGKRDAILEVREVIYEGGYPNWTGTWYPKRFCIMEGNLAFVMSFYDYERETINLDLYKQIVSTVKFE